METINAMVAANDTTQPAAAGNITPFIQREIANLQAIVEARLMSLDRSMEAVEASIGRRPAEIESAIRTSQGVQDERTEALRRHIEVRINAADHATELFRSQIRLDVSVAIANIKELYDARVSALREAMAQAETKIEARFAQVDMRFSASLASAKEAVDKAEAANERRFDAVNEFRSALSDQQTSLMPRSEADARIVSVTEKVTDLTARFAAREGNHAGKDSDKTALLATASVAISLIVGGYAILGNRAGPGVAAVAPAAVAVMPLKP